MIKLFDGDKELNQDLFPLDNFSLYGITMDGITFKTGEHAFQYLKFIGFNDKIANKVLNADTPLDARNIAIENKKSRNPNWKDIKYDCMLNIFKLKAEQNPIVKETLLKTGNYTIIEMCEDEDTDWGVDKNLQGENNLGKLWMKVRDELVGGTIVLTSCGLRNDELKERFYSVVSKEE